MLRAAGDNLTEEQQREWVILLKDSFPEASVYYNPLSVSIGCHTGPGAIGVGVTIL